MSGFVLFADIFSVSFFFSSNTLNDHDRCVIQAKECVNNELTHWDNQQIIHLQFAADKEPLPGTLSPKH